MYVSWSQKQKKRDPYRLFAYVTCLCLRTHTYIQTHTKIIPLNHHLWPPRSVWRCLYLLSSAWIFLFCCLSKANMRLQRSESQIKWVSSTVTEIACLCYYCVYNVWWNTRREFCTKKGNFGKYPHDLSSNCWCLIWTSADTFQIRSRTVDFDSHL